MNGLLALGLFRPKEPPCNPDLPPLISSWPTRSSLTPLPPCLLHSSPSPRLLRSVDPTSTCECRLTCHHFTPTLAPVANRLDLLTRLVIPFLTLSALLLRKWPPARNRNCKCSPHRLNSHPSSLNSFKPPLHRFSSYLFITVSPVDIQTTLDGKL